MLRPLEVANVKKIVTAPALLESTSLVFAFGLDIFLTSVAPSSNSDNISEKFAKVQPVTTIPALAVAILITRPHGCQKETEGKVASIDRPICHRDVQGNHSLVIGRNRGHGCFACLSLMGFLHPRCVDFLRSKQVTALAQAIGRVLFAGVSL